MFTGIIEEIGVVAGKKQKGNLHTISISAKSVMEDLKPGDSIATDGACLTVTSKEKNSFSVDIMQETLNKTSLGKLRAGSKVNLERSLKMEGRIAGHFVLGHVDGTAQISKVLKEGNNVVYTIKPPFWMMRYIAFKGCIAVDGISLTIAKREQTEFNVALIPFTLMHTTIGGKRAGEEVNIELDMLAKYLETITGKGK